MSAEDANSNRRILKNSAIYAIGQFLPMAVSFLLLPVVTRYLSKDEFGIVTSIVALASILAVVATLQVDNAVRRCYFDYKTGDERKRFIGTILLSVVGLNALTVVVCLLGRRLLDLVFPGVPFFPYYLIGIFQVAVISTFNVFQILYQTMEKPVPFVCMSLLTFFLNLGFLLTFVVALDMKALGMLLAPLCAYLLALPVAIVVARRWFVLAWDRAMFRNASAYGIRVMPYMLSSTLLANTDRVLLAHLSSNAQLGLYGVAFKLANIVYMATQALLTSYQPYFFRIAASEERAKVEGLLGALSTQVMLLLLVVLVAVILLMDEIVAIMLDARFSDAARVAPWLASAVLFHSFSAIMGLGANFAKKHLWFAWIVLAGGVLNVGLDLLVIPRYGAVGAAVATAAAALVMMFLRLACSQHYWPVRFAYRPLLEVGAAGAMMIFAAGWLCPPGQLLLISMTFKTGLYLLFGLFVVRRMHWGPKLAAICLRLRRPLG
ncbi:MAG: oligosaccharide flippase family protein [Kiritimatiellae bacterium]|nr:oligosaccharide flippase family protein [Kiritimatiellia bacterium]